jgi:hypothetical protein
MALVGEFPARVVGLPIPPTFLMITRRDIRLAAVDRQNITKRETLLIGVM